MEKSFEVAAAILTSSFIQKELHFINTSKGNGFSFKGTENDEKNIAEIVRIYNCFLKFISVPDNE